jgi:predicted dinucleotide-binding enzyme
MIYSRWLRWSQRSLVGNPGTSNLRDPWQTLSRTNVIRVGASAPCRKENRLVSIAIIGSGNIGGTLGRAFARAGMDTVFGSRRPGECDAPGATSARVANVSEALIGAHIVVLAQPGGVVVEFLREHAAALDGTLIVDTANRFSDPALNSAADVTALVPGARYARAFNSVGWENLADPVYRGVHGDHFFSCEADDEAAVAELVEAVGLRPICLGPGQSELVDSVLRLFIALALESGRNLGRHIGLRVLTD